MRTWQDELVTKNVVVDDCHFVTERLRVEEWHAAAEQVGRALAEIVAELLTVRTTSALPPSWQGDFSIDRATRWIGERDAESPTLLAVEAMSSRPVGLVVLAEDPIAESKIDLRIGYVIAEEMWGRAFATELVAGLVDWARTMPMVQTLTGGVDIDNGSSIRVLEKNGFSRRNDLDSSNQDANSAIYVLDLRAVNEWDSYAESWDADEGARAYASAAWSSLLEALSGLGLGPDGKLDGKLDEKRVIDFGCGTGLLTQRLVEAGASVTAVDTSPEMLKVLDAKIADRGWIAVATSGEIPPAGTTFDLVVCSSVCSFLDDYPGTVQDLVSRLDPGGVFIQWDWERTGDDPHGLTRTEIQAALTGAGLEGVEVETAFAAEVDGQTMEPLRGSGRRPPDGFARA